MAKYKYIPIDIYKRGIYVFIGNHKEFKRWVTEYFDDDPKYKGLIEYVQDLERDNALASFWYNSKTGDGIIEIPKMPRTPSEIAYCTHECLHAAFHVLDYIGVEYESNGNNESFTYMLEHLVKNLLDINDYHIA